MPRRVSLFDDHPFVDVAVETEGAETPAIEAQASLRQILNDYYMKRYDLHSLQAVDLVDRHIAALREMI